jgi:hypothetical protein
MADNDKNDFLITVTADIEKAGRGLDQIAKQIETITKEGNEKFGFLDKAIGGIGTSMLGAAATITPYGRALSAVIDTLQSAVGVARQFADAAGAKDEFTALEAAVNELGVATGGVLAEGVIKANNALLSFAGYTAEARGSGMSFADTVKLISVNARDAVQQLQVLVESVKPIEQRSTNALDIQIANTRSEIERLGEAIRRLEAGERPDRPGILQWLLNPVGNAALGLGFFTPSIDSLKEALAELERMLPLLEQVRGSRFGPWDPSVNVQAIDESIEALKKQNRELEITVAVMNMAAGAAARYRAEQQAMNAAGELFAQANQQQREELERQIKRRAELAEAEAAGRKAQEEARKAEQRERQAERMEIGREGEIERLEGQIRTLGQLAGAIARATFEERAFQQLRQAGIPITEQQRVVILAQGQAVEQLTNRLAEAKRQMAQLEEAGRAVSSSLERAFTGWLSGAELSWKQFFNSLMRDLALIALRQNILQPLFGGGGVSGGGMFGTFLSGLLGIPSGGARASGGPVSAGTMYMVGEHGPEPFIPAVDGMILPHGAGRGGAVIEMRVDLAGANGDETIARISAQAARAAAVQAVEASNAAFPARQNQLHMLGT